jgi:hypothetical protein
MSDNIWRDFAQLNDMTEEDFSSEVITSAMAMMSLKLDKSDLPAIKVTKGQYTLMLVDNEKQEK